MKGFKLILVLLSFFTLLSCQNPVKLLPSSNRNQAIKAAETIVNTQGKLRVSQKDLPYLISALSSENKLITLAGVRGLSNLGKVAVKPLIDTLTNRQYQANKHFRQLKTLFDVSKYIKDPYLHISTRVRLVNLIREYDKDVARQTLDKLYNLLETLEEEEEENIEILKARLLPEFGAVYYFYDKEIALDCFETAYQLGRSLEESDDRMNYMRSMLNALDLLEPNERKLYWDRLNGIAQRMWDTELKDQAYYCLANSALDRDISQAYSVAQQISGNWRLVLKLARTAVGIDRKTAKLLYDKAYSIIRSQKYNSQLRLKGYTDLAVALIDFDIPQALQWLDQISQDDIYRASLLNSLAVKVAPSDPQRARFFIDLIIYESNKLVGLTNLTYWMVHSTNYSLSNILLLTNRLKDPQPVLQILALETVKTNSQAAAELAAQLSFNLPIDRIRFWARYAVNLAAIEPKASHKLFENLLLTNSLISNEIEFMDALNAIIQQISQIQTYDASALWARSTNLIPLLNMNHRSQMLEKIIYEYAVQDIVAASELMATVRADQAVVDSIDYVLRQDILFPEKQALIDIGTNAVESLINLLIDSPSITSLQRKDVLSILLAINKKYSIDNSLLLPLLSLLDRNKDDLTSSLMVIRLFKNTDQSIAVNTFIKLLLDEDYVEWHPTLLETLSSVDKPQLFEPYVDQLTQMLSSSKTTEWIKVNCIHLLSLTGLSSVIEPISDVFYDVRVIGDNKIRNIKSKHSIPESIVSAAIEALVRLKAESAVELIARYLDHPTLYYQAALALGKLGGISYLIQNRSKTPSIAILEALTRYAPNKKKYQLLGYTGYPYDPLIHQMMMNGFDPIRVESKEAAKQFGCELLIVGKYEQERLNDPVEISDPAGSFTIYSEAHHLFLELYKLNNSKEERIWRISAWGRGSTWDTEVSEFGKEPQQIISDNAQRAMLYEMKKNFDKNKYNLPFNYSP